jgi:adenine-specific DNA-methyltransferase
VLTSYSTDGTIALRELLAANVARGRVRLEMKGYKRYRVSSQRFSHKPLNIEFVVVLDTQRKSDVSAEELYDLITTREASELERHPESGSAQTARALS